MVARSRFAALRTIRRLTLLRSLLLVLMIGTTARCVGVLGIEDATCDPTQPGCQANTSAPVDTASPLCQTYCDSVLTNCTGMYAVYVGPDTCRAVCAKLDPGKVGDESVNTVECRRSHAENVAKFHDPQGECSGAGPGGDGTCGANCEGYCTLMQSSCTGPFQEYASMDACLTACRAVPDKGGFDSSQTVGNTLQCRLWHASVAAASPNPHCRHAAGASPCN